ncbi:MAG: hypothetical protein AB7T31_05685 [Gemmatimonadales bacterium]
MTAEIAAIRAERPGVDTVAASDPADPAPFELALWILDFDDVAFAMDFASWCLRCAER